MGEGGVFSLANPSTHQLEWGKAIHTYVLGTSLSVLVFSVSPGGAILGDC